MSITPKPRRSQSVGRYTVPHAASAAVTAPPSAAGHTCRHFTVWWRKCKNNATGEHSIKYNKFIPAAVRWATPTTAVKYNSNNVPPPTPHPLMNPAAAPTNNSMITVTTPPLPRRTARSRPSPSAATARECGETRFPPTHRRPHRPKDTNPCPLPPNRRAKNTR